MQLQLEFIIYFLPVSSGFHFHTHTLRSIFRVFYALRTVHITPVTSHQHAQQHGYNAVAGQCGAGSHVPRRNRHPLPTKSVENVGNHMERKRLDRLDVAIQLQLQFIIYFLPVSSGFYFHTHAFRSLFRVFYALRTVHITPVTSHQHAPQHGYNAVAGQCGAGSHLPRKNRHPLPTKSAEKVGKQIFEITWRDKDWIG
jgi:hypothetical protein